MLKNAVTFDELLGDEVDVDEDDEDVDEDDDEDDDEVVEFESPTERSPPGESELWGDEEDDEDDAEDEEEREEEDERVDDKLGLFKADEELELLLVFVLLVLMMLPFATIAKVWSLFWSIIF